MTESPEARRQEDIQDEGQVDGGPAEGQADAGQQAQAPEEPRETASSSAPADAPADSRAGSSADPSGNNPADGARSGDAQATPEEASGPGLDLETRVKELTADLQRVQAEFLNYKRRVDRDRDLVLQNAKFSILSALLPVLDNVDRAREHEELDGGFKAVAESLERIVAGEGLVRFGAPGDEFDPRYHEALTHSLSAEVETTTCDKVVQAGYRIDDRVVRPALVTVVDPDPAGSGGDVAATADAQDAASAGTGAGTDAGTGSGTGAGSHAGDEGADV